MKLSERFSIDMRVLRRAALFSLLFLFAAHAFCFFNLTYTGSSVMLDVSKGRSAQIAQGRFLAPYYFRLRGTLSAPMLVGMLSAAYLTLTAMLAAWLLRLEKTEHLFILCGTLCANAALTSLFASSLHTADAACLALLLAALAAACCLRLRMGCIPGALLLAAAMALDPASASFFASLWLAAFISDCLLPEDIPSSASAPQSLSATSSLSGAAACRRHDGGMIAMLKAVLSLAAGAALWTAGCMLFARRSGTALSLPIGLPEGGLWAAWLSSICALFSPLTAYAKLNVLLRALSLLFCLCALVRCAKKRGAVQTAMLLCGMLALALLTSPALFGEQITPACLMLDVLVLVLLSRLVPDRSRLHQLAACAFGALFLGSIVFANQVYLKKNLELESSLSLTSRIIQRAEETPGYQPGFTPVAVVGTMEDSVFSVPRRGFEHLSALDAARANTAVTSDEEMIWYCWEILGYPFNFVSTFELDQLKESAAVQGMPVFPAEGCCAFVDGVLVIRLN